MDADGDGVDDQTDVLDNALAYVDTRPKYKSRYYQTGYPDDGYGVCTYNPLIYIRLIPYYAWGNRGKAEMTVWMPLARTKAAGKQAQNGLQHHQSQVHRSANRRYPTLPPRLLLTGYTFYIQQQGLLTRIYPLGSVDR